MYDQIHKILSSNPIIPIIDINSIKQCEKTVNSLFLGEINILEITLRTPFALQAIKHVTKLMPNFIIGIGTITKTGYCKKAKKNGAKFGVSPGFTKEIHNESKKHNFPLIPGITTTTEIMTVLQLGYKILKFFHAIQYGGISMLNNFKQIFPKLTFCPTGGITEKSALHFLSLSNVLCIGGSWITRINQLKQKKWKKIEKLAYNAYKISIKNALNF